MSKVIAVMDKPDNCQECVFGICKYSLPLSICRKGYYCQLLPPEKRVVQGFDYGAEVRLDNCPLVPMPEKMLKTGEGWVDGWNAAIDEIGGKNGEC